MRKLPIYIVADSSGKNIEILKARMNEVFNTLRSEPYFLENTWVTIVSIGKSVKIESPLVELPECQPFTIFPQDTICLRPILPFIRSRILTDLTNADPGPWLCPLVLIFLSSIPEDIEEVTFTHIEVANVCAIACGLDSRTEEMIGKAFKWIVTEETLSRYSMAELIEKYLITFVYNDDPLDVDFWRSNPSRIL